LRGCSSGRRAPTVSLEVVRTRADLAGLVVGVEQSAGVDREAAAADAGREPAAERLEGGDLARRSRAVPAPTRLSRRSRSPSCGPRVRAGRTAGARCRPSRSVSRASSTSTACAASWRRRCAGVPGVARATSTGWSRSAPRGRRRRRPRSSSRGKGSWPDEPRLELAAGAGGARDPRRRHVRARGPRGAGARAHRFPLEPISRVSQGCGSHS
jgi:hypothetical protein